MPLKKKGTHWYLTDEEVQFIRNQLNSMRPRETYEPGKWYVSNLNRKPEVLGAALPDHMPDSIVLRDITLRTIEQVPGVSITPAERRHLLRALAEAGVPSIQLMCFYGTKNPIELYKDEVKLIKSINPEVEIEADGLMVRSSIDAAVEMGVSSASINGPANFSIAPIYSGEICRMAWEGRDWRREANPPKDLDDLVERNRGLIEYAHKRGIKIQANLNMLLYATEDVIRSFAREMSAAGADCICLMDGPGGMGPHAIAHAVTIAKKAAPRAKIGVHLHNSFNLGVALNISAAQAGADILEVSVNGYCAAAGQTDLAHIAAALEIMYGVRTGIRLEQLTYLRRLGEDITRVPVARNHPITGEEYFNWGGLENLIMERSVDPLIHWSVNGSVFGNKNKTMIDRTSGPWAVLDKLTELGVAVEKAEVEAIVPVIQGELQVRKRSLSDDEIRSIAEKIIGRK